MFDIIAPSHGENIYGFLVVFTIGTFSANIFLSEHFQGENRTKIGSSELMTFANVMMHATLYGCTPRAVEKNDFGNI